MLVMEEASYKGRRRVEVGATYNSYKFVRENLAVTTVGTAQDRCSITRTKSWPGKIKGSREAIQVAMASPQRLTGSFHLDECADGEYFLVVLISTSVLKWLVPCPSYEHIHVIPVMSLRQIV